MARPNSETVTTFGEVLHSANNAHSGEAELLISTTGL